MQYRNDLEAARLRINTLEAKLEETKASLNARDAEIAEWERRWEVERGTDRATQTRWSLAAIAVLGLAFGVPIGFFIGAKTTSGSAADGPKTQQIQTVTEDGPRAEGRIVPPAPDPPKAHSEGQAIVPPPEARASAATVAGQTNLPDPDATVDSVVQSARPKLKDCYREETKQHPKASGSVNVLFDIEPSGKASNVKLEPGPFLTPWWSKSFETCVAREYGNLTFPNATATKARASGTYFFSAIDLAF